MISEWKILIKKISWSVKVKTLKKKKKAHMGKGE